VKKLTIRGIQCVMEPDEKGFGFVDITIEHPDGTVFGLPGAKLYYEWIVRGALDERSAVALAARIIEAKLNEKSIGHDTEGLIRLVDDPNREGENWKTEVCQ
jgi:hypothetical protein